MRVTAALKMNAKGCQFKISVPPCGKSPPLHQRRMTDVDKISTSVLKFDVQLLFFLSFKLSLVYFISILFIFKEKGGSISCSESFEILLATEWKREARRHERHPTSCSRSRSACCHFSRGKRAQMARVEIARRCRPAHPPPEINSIWCPEDGWIPPQRRGVYEFSGVFG